MIPLLREHCNFSFQTPRWRVEVNRRVLIGHPLYPLTHPPSTKFPRTRSPPCSSNFTFLSTLVVDLADSVLGLKGGSYSNPSQYAKLLIESKCAIPHSRSPSPSIRSRQPGPPPCHDKVLAPWPSSSTWPWSLYSSPARAFVSLSFSSSLSDYIQKSTQIDT